jgi:hypothetical protein
MIRLSVWLTFLLISSSHGLDVVRDPVLELMASSHHVSSASELHDLPELEENDADDAAVIKELQWGDTPGFSDLYEMFQSLFGGSFSLPKVTLGSNIISGFKSGVNNIWDSINTLLKSGQGEMMLVQTSEQFMPPVPGAYGVIKLGEKDLWRPILSNFCSAIKFFTDPIFRAFNSVLALVTGVIPVWLVKVIAFGGLGALIHTFLFEAFTVSGTFSIGYPMAGFANAVNTFEAGFSLEIKQNLQIGRTGCFLGGASGLAGPAGLTPIKGEVGFAIAAWKKEPMIAGETVTAGGQVDICKIFALPCQAKLGGGFIFDNSKGNAGRLWDTCKGIFGFGEESEQEQVLALVDVGGKRTGQYFSMEAIQTMSSEELQTNILTAAKDFFINGFKNIETCLREVFVLWTGLALDGDCGVSLDIVPASATFVWGYSIFVSADVSSSASRRRRSSSSSAASTAGSAGASAATGNPAVGNPGGSCKHGQAGTCGKPSTCSGQLVSGYCNGGSDNVCCAPSSSSSSSSSSSRRTNKKSKKGKKGKRRRSRGRRRSNRI